MDLSTLPNPYDFANPVMDPELFAGRTKEMNDISYYLDHASRAQRPINLAIMGDRASGKTSLLNKIQLFGSERQICVVRIDLDEGDALSQMDFFYKIFDSLLTTVCFQGSYGGLIEKTYQTYRNMVDAYEIPEDKTFCPFVFPFQYANAVSKGNHLASLSDTAFKQDICEIQKELQRIILFIFDECDVLAASRVHLQKLRNIFMNTPGFMLVFAGTPTLFPIMDDVFSPIVRQFKKINLGPFESWQDTEKCILRPLDKVGLSNTANLINPGTVREIHELSAGKPYEIQLVCHFLFRRIQDGRARRLEINVDILDDVKRELENSQDVFQRPFLSAIRHLSNRELSALNILCGADKHASFDQLWFAEYMYRGESRWKRDEVRQHLTKFVELELLAESDKALQCLGDDFDRIYCKYFARNKKVMLSISERTYEALLMSSLTSFLAKHLKEKFLNGFDFVTSETEEVALAPIASQFSESASDPFGSRPHLARHIYSTSLHYADQSLLTFMHIRIVTPWNSGYIIYSTSGIEPSLLESTISELNCCSERARENGGDIIIRLERIPPIPIELLVEKASQSSNKKVWEVLYQDHVKRMTTCYLEKRDMPGALRHAEIALRYNYTPDADVANNIGYVFMIWERYLEAENLFEIAIKNHKTSSAKALPIYNLGIVKIKEGKLDEALTLFKSARGELESSEQEESPLACLVVPKLAPCETELVFEEVLEPLLSKAIQTSISAIEALTGGQ